MPQSSSIIMMVMGGVFILLGLVAMFWDRREAKSYYDSLSSRPDSREFLDHWPPRPQFGALKIGGWIAIAIGVIMLIIGLIFWLWG
jgi:uncharacterized membrane protein YwaF